MCWGIRFFLRAHQCKQISVRVTTQCYQFGSFPWYTLVLGVHVMHQSDTLYSTAVWFQCLKLQNNLSTIFKKQEKYQDMNQSAE